MAKRAKVTIEGVKKIQSKLLGFYDKSVTSETFLKSQAIFISDQIQKRTKAGQDEYRQKKLNPISVQARKFYSKHFQVDQYAKPDRSNLTLTGQLLDAIKFSITTTTATIKFFLSDARVNKPFDDELAKEDRLKEIKRKVKRDQGSFNENTKYTYEERTKLKALQLLTENKPKGNREIKKDLEAKGRRFMFLSELLKATLEKRIKKVLREKLAEYKRLK